MKQQELTCIDNIASNITDATGAVHPLGISDHTAQSICFTIANQLPAHVTTYYKLVRDYRNSNISKFKNCLKTLSWSSVYNTENFNSAFREFLSTVTTFYDISFPNIRLKVNLNKNKNVWITKGLKKSCKIKKQLRYNYYTKKSHLAKETYLKYNKILRKCITCSQKLSNKKYLENSKNKCLASWKIIKENNNNKNSNYIDKIYYNNECIDDPKKIADLFNYTFLDTEKKKSTKR